MLPVYQPLFCFSLQSVSAIRFWETNCVPFKCCPYIARPHSKSTFDPVPWSWSSPLLRQSPTEWIPFWCSAPSCLSRSPDPPSRPKHFSLSPKAPVLTKFCRSVSCVRLCSSLFSVCAAVFFVPEMFCLYWRNFKFSTGLCNIKQTKMTLLYDWN